MPIKSYNRPVNHPTISTPINIGFAGSLQATAPSFFTLFTAQKDFAHHDIVVIGDETFQWVDPGISNAVTNDTYIAVLKLNTGNGIDFTTLSWALGRYTGAQEPSLATFAPTLTDLSTLAPTMTSHKFVVKSTRFAPSNTDRWTTPQPRQLIVLHGTAFSAHDLVTIGADTYEALVSGTGSPATLTNDAYIPFDCAIDWTSSMTELRDAINRTRVAYAGTGYLNYDGVTPTPLRNGTANVNALEQTYNTSNAALIITDASGPGGVTCSTTTVLTVTFPAGFAAKILLNTFGSTASMLTPVQACAIVVFNAVGTLGPKELGGNQVMASGVDQIPGGLSDNHGVQINSGWVRDLDAISRLADSGDTLTFYVEADADERNDHDLIGHVFRIDFTPTMQSSGVFEIDTLVTPIHGDGSDALEPYPTLIMAPHDQNMDTWQTEKGRPRQDVSEVVIGDDDQLLSFGNVFAQ